MTGFGAVSIQKPSEARCGDRQVAQYMTLEAVAPHISHSIDCGSGGLGWLNSV